MGYNEFYISFNHIFLTFILFYSRDTLKWQSRFVYGEGLYLQKGIRLFASVLSAAISGMEVCPVQVEADVSSGLPCFTMVGFPSTQVKEAQDRVRTALKNNGISLPPKKVTVNLAPADLRKEGAGFDLPVAAAVLAALGFIEPQLLRNVMVVGELSLNGEVRSVSGVLPRVIRARELGCRYCIIPFENLAEGALVKDMKVVGVQNIKEVLKLVSDPDAFGKENQFSEENSEENQAEESLVDFGEICGQESARRAAEIAVSGFHNILFIGPPGTGKTMLAKRIPTIMPSLTFEESLELTKIYSIAGLLSPKRPLIKARPFRSPHHTSSSAALAGGGRIPGPGEVTLAHRGVLFLDEMPEFSRASLELLRQPMEDKVIQIARASGTYNFPADFMLCAAMNPCPCGYYPDLNRCTCTAGEITHYMGKISRPLLDRIDISTEVPPVSFSQLHCGRKGENSAAIRKRVEKVQKIQEERYKDEKINFNGQLKSSLIDKFCPLTDCASRLLARAFEKIAFSARSYHRILKVARTIADMEGEEMIAGHHIGEALSYRAFDKDSVIK